MIKIVFVQYHTNTIYTEKNYYLDVLIKNGFDVEYWDVSKIFFDNLKITESGSIRKGYEVYLSSYDELEQEIKKQNLVNTIFINQITYELRVLKLFRLFSKYHCIVYRNFVGMLPQYSSMGKKIKNNLNVKVFQKIINIIVPSLYKKLKLVSNYHTVFAAGEMSIKLYSQTAKVIPINFFDYDKYLLIKANNERLIKERYCVYLDDNWASHPDVKMLKLAPLNAENHYNSLKRFFDSIENQFDIKIIVAAHPRSEHPLSDYGNREIIKYQTAELVKDAEFVLTSISTSMSNAVLFNKPIIFFYTEEIKEKYRHTQYSNIKLYSNILGAKLINVNNYMLTDLALNPINYEKYKSYKYLYLTSKESENIHSSEIVLKYFQNLSH